MRRRGIDQLGRTGGGGSIGTFAIRFKICAPSCWECPIGTTNVIGRAPVMCVQRNDLLPPETGFQWCVLHGGDLRVRRFFVSYSGKRVVWYIGHQPTGFFGCKFNLHSSS
jgi:hypothetical protein